MPAAESFKAPWRSDAARARGFAGIKPELGRAGRDRARSLNAAVWRVIVQTLIPSASRHCATRWGARRQRLGTAPDAYAKHVVAKLYGAPFRYTQPRPLLQAVQGLVPRRSAARREPMPQRMRAKGLRRSQRCYTMKPCDHCPRAFREQVRDITQARSTPAAPRARPRRRAGDRGPPSLEMLAPGQRRAMLLLAAPHLRAARDDARGQL